MPDTLPVGNDAASWHVQMEAITQVTDEMALVSNIYSEQPYATHDSSAFVYARQMNQAGPHDRSDWEFILCSFGDWRRQVIGRGSLVITTHQENAFYYQHWEHGQNRVIRVDLETLASRTIWTSDQPYLDHPTVSCDGRLLAYGYLKSHQPQQFVVEVVDLQQRVSHIALADPSLGNPHLQFDPGHPTRLMVQVNRGCVSGPDGRLIKSVDERGATLWLLDAITGQVDPLPVGKPHTPFITGHQAWISKTGRIITTVHPEGEYAPGPGAGNTLILEHGQPAKQLGTGITLGHIGCLLDGSFAFGDTLRHNRIAIIDPATGKTVVVHEDANYPGNDGFGQHNHPHAYMTPNRQWMVFNSDRTGRPQVYAARLKWH